MWCLSPLRTFMLRGSGCVCVCVCVCVHIHTRHIYIYMYDILTFGWGEDDTGTQGLRCAQCFVYTYTSS